MPFNYNSTGVALEGDFTIPDDEYVLEIVSAVEGQSKKGEPQVKVDYKVAEGQRAGFPVKFHYVTFKPSSEKSAGMAVHFLKTIGQPWEGDFKVDASKWIGKKLLAYLAAETYGGYTNMKVKWVKPIEGQKAEAEEEVPF